MIVNVGIQFF